jgi:hypothetical protein
MSSAYPANSISFCRTDTKAVFLQINTDGTVIWKGREVESDADFRAAMMEVHQHMCGSANGKLATARAPLAEVERLRAELAALKACDPLAEMWAALESYQEQADKDGHGESWRRMCEERTQEAASDAYRARQVQSHVAASAYGAWWAAQRHAAVRRLSKEAVEWAANAVAAIRRAKEGMR